MPRQLQCFGKEEGASQATAEPAANSADPELCPCSYICAWRGLMLLPLTCLLSERRVLAMLLSKQTEGLWEERQT